MVPWRRDGALGEGRLKRVHQRRIGQRRIHGGAVEHAQGQVPGFSRTATKHNQIPDT